MDRTAGREEPEVTDARGGTRRRRPRLKLTALVAVGLGLALAVPVAGAGIAGASTASKASPAHSRHAKHAKHAKHANHSRHAKHSKSSKYEAVSKFPHYVGGHGAANKKLSPVTIGVVNQQTSTNAVVPAWTTGAKIAVKYINQHAHGIDGHPLKAVYCKIPTSVSSAAKCGQRFANSGKIAAVAAGPIDVGNQALESAMKPSKVALVMSVSLSTVDTKYPYGYILNGDVLSIEPPIGTFVVKDLHAKSVSIAYPDNVPGDVTSANVIAKAIEYAGVKKVYKVGFTSAETNLTAPFEAAHVGHTTVFVAALSGPGCSDTYLTLKSLNVKTTVVTNAPCDTPTVVAADGGQLPPDWYYLTANALPGDKSTRGLRKWGHVAAKYHEAKIAGNPWVFNAFAQVLTIAKWDTKILKKHKRITPKTVNDIAKSFKGPVLDGPPRIKCGAIKGEPANCSDSASIFQNTAPTVMKPIAYYLGPPKGFKVGQ